MERGWLSDIALQTKGAGPHALAPAIRIARAALGAPRPFLDSYSMSRLAKACDDVLCYGWSNRRSRRTRPCVLPAPGPGDKRDEMGSHQGLRQADVCPFCSCSRIIPWQPESVHTCRPGDPRCWHARWSLHASGHRSTGTRTFATQSEIREDQTKVVSTRMGLTHGRVQWPWSKHTVGLWFRNQSMAWARLGRWGLGTRMMSRARGVMRRTTVPSMVLLVRVVAIPRGRQDGRKLADGSRLGVRSPLPSLAVSPVSLGCNSATPQ